MPKLPVLSAHEVIRGFQRLGFERVGQSGSHIKLRRAGTNVIVPDHREIRKGTLAGILKQSGVTIDQLMNVISH